MPLAPIHCRHEGNGLGFLNFAAAAPPARTDATATPPISTPYRHIFKCFQLDHFFICKLLKKTLIYDIHMVSKVTYFKGKNSLVFFFTLLVGGLILQCDSALTPPVNSSAVDGWLNGLAEKMASLDQPTVLYSIASWEYSTRFPEWTTG